MRIFIHLIAIRLLPTHSRYGEWPRSGEIDLLESRGNRDYKDHSGINIGVEHVSSTLHFGSRFEDDAFMTASYSRDYPSGYHDDFHKYEYVWSESGIRFSVDGSEIGYAAADKGFWKHGGLTGHDIWASSTKMAPFDEEVRGNCYLFFFLEHVLGCRLSLKRKIGFRSLVCTKVIN